MKIKQKSNIRTFLAIDLPENLKMSLSKQVQDMKVISYSRTLTPTKTVAPLNYHLTLAFLGNITKEELDNLTERLKKVKLKKKLNCKIAGLGAFPNIKAARLIFMGVECPELEELATKIRHIAISMGFRFNHDFKPHITIIRFKEKIPLLDLDTLEGTFTITSFYLMQSILTVTGPLYSKLEKFDI
jgi:2'-5' RNA ligase